MASKRLDLTPGVIKEALKLALEGSRREIVDYCDRLQSYLVLRVRGHPRILGASRRASNSIGRGRFEPRVDLAPRILRLRQTIIAQSRGLESINI